MVQRGKWKSQIWFSRVLMIQPSIFQTPDF
jgi:hypothetical protein